jgi:hypothetical protein
MAAGIFVFFSNAVQFAVSCRSISMSVSHRGWHFTPFFLCGERIMWSCILISTSNAHELVVGPCHRLDINTHQIQNDFMFFTLLTYPTYLGIKDLVIVVVVFITLLSYHKNYELFFFEIRWIKLAIIWSYKAWEVFLRPEKNSRWAQYIYDCSYFVLYTSKEKKGEKGKERKKYMWVRIAPKFNISIDLFWAEPVVSKKSTS